MKPYKDTDGDSGITFFDYGADWIEILWHKHVYRYEASQIGPEHIEKMKNLADGGNKLNTYINQHPDVKSGYSSKR